MASDDDILAKSASFLGLATETRLEIYSYLLIPSFTTEQLKELKDRKHCCAFPHSRKQYNHLNRDDDIIDVACDCNNQNLHPQILRTNKQIFNEAVHILYEHMEFHVRLPPFSSFRDSPLQTAIKALPTYSYKHIKRMVIVGTPGEASEMHKNPGGRTWSYPMEQYTDLISATFPNMQQVRFHIDFGASPQNGGRTRVESFGFIMGLPKLEFVSVEVDGGGMPVRDGCWADTMRERVVEAVKKAQRCYQKEDVVEVREVLEEGDCVWIGED